MFASISSLLPPRANQYVPTKLPSGLRGEMGQNEKVVHCDGNCWEGRRGRGAYENRVREEKRLRLETPSELHLSQHPSTQAGSSFLLIPGIKP